MTMLIFAPDDVLTVECRNCGTWIPETEAVPMDDSGVCEWLCKECAELPPADPLPDKPRPEISSREYEKTARGFRAK